MTSRTHDLASFTAMNIMVVSQIIPGVNLSTALTAISIGFIGGLIPDIDNSSSEFWHKLPAGSIFGRIFHPFFGGHRLISHSLIGLVIFAFAAKYLFNLASHTFLVNMNIVWWAFIIGYISHLVMDCLTSEGIPLLFPIPIHFGFPPLKIFRIRTGGLVEKLIIFPLLCFINIYLFFNFSSIYLRLFKMFIK